MWQIKQETDAHVIIIALFGTDWFQQYSWLINLYHNFLFQYEAAHEKKKMYTSEEYLNVQRLLNNFWVLR